MKKKTQKRATKHSVSKKAVSKKAVSKKAVSKKAVSKKAVSKKAVSKKAVSKKAVSKKAVSKKGQVVPITASFSAAMAATVLGHSATANGIRITLKPTPVFQTSTPLVKLEKLKLVRGGCLNAAESIGVKIGRDVIIDVEKTEVGTVSIRDPNFMVLQLSVSELNVSGQELSPGFDSHAKSLAMTLAALGKANEVWA